MSVTFINTKGTSPSQDEGWSDAWDSAKQEYNVETGKKKRQSRKRTNPAERRPKETNWSKLRLEGIRKHTDVEDVEDIKHLITNWNLFKSFADEVRDKKDDEILKSLNERIFVLFKKGLELEPINFTISVAEFISRKGFRTKNKLVLIVGQTFKMRTMHGGFRALLTSKEGEIARVNNMRAYYSFYDNKGELIENIKTIIKNDGVWIGDEEVKKSMKPVYFKKGHNKGGYRVIFSRQLYPYVPCDGDVMYEQTDILDVEDAISKFLVKHYFPKFEKNQKTKKTSPVKKVTSLKVRIFENTFCNAVYPFSFRKSAEGTLKRLRIDFVFFSIFL